MYVHLLEPDAGGRISGGYVYNARIAAGAPGSVLRHGVRPGSLASDVATLELTGPGWVLADSLFLNAAHAPELARLRTAELEVGVVLHAFPSFIARAGDRGALEAQLPLSPTDEELSLLEQFELVVAPGPYVPRLLATAGARVRTVVCPPGVDPAAEHRHWRGACSAPLKLISLGGVTRLKGFSDGLEALGRVGAGVEWTIVGHVGLEPDFVASLERRAAELGFASSLRFAGQRSHLESLALLADADALLLPSYTENAPLVALEALAASVPVLGYAAGGVPDLIRHGETGLLAPVLDIEALADLIRSFRDDAPLRARLGDASARAGRVLPSWDAAARGFVAELERAYAARERRHSR